MKRTLILAIFAAAFASAGVAVADPRFQLLVPVEIEHVPAEIVKGMMECRVSSTTAFDMSTVIGTGRSEFAIEGGRYSGRVGVEAFPAGFPAGTDGTLEGRSYMCTLFLYYRCTSSTGSGEGWCVSSAGGGAPTGASAPVARLFETDAAHPPAGRIIGTIDRSTATTLPMFR